MRTNDKLIETLRKVAGQYPTGMIEDQLRDVRRIAFNIGVGLERLEPKPPTSLTICDLGGGVGLFSVGCAAYGFERTVLVDDFNDSVNSRIGDSILDLHRSYGVEVVSRDVVAVGIRDVAGDFDIITSFDSMEHWHHSPKRLFHDVAEKLKRGGLFVLAVPNRVNLKKRLTIPLGLGKWSGIEEWYEADVFRGHVREPDVSDLRYIAHDMGLADVTILGRNWLGSEAANPVIRLAAKTLDRPLRLRPSLCSDIYLVGRKV